MSAKFLVLLAAMVLILSSCVSSGFMDFDTAEPLAPLHFDANLGAEASSANGQVPDVFTSLRMGLFPGADMGIRVGIGTLLGDFKYTLPLGWREASFSIGANGGANFGYKVYEIQAPLIFSYRFSSALAVVASQATSFYIGNYGGFAISGGLGLKWNIRHFCLYPKIGGGFLAPKGDWSLLLGSTAFGSFSTTFAEQQVFLCFGLAVGFDF